MRLILGAQPCHISVSIEGEGHMQGETCQCRLFMQPKEAQRQRQLPGDVPEAQGSQEGIPSRKNLGRAEVGGSLAP